MGLVSKERRHSGSGLRAMSAARGTLEAGRARCRRLARELSGRLGRERRKAGGEWQGDIVGWSSEVNNIDIMHSMLRTVP